MKQWGKRHFRFLFYVELAFITSVESWEASEKEANVPAAFHWANLIDGKMLEHYATFFDANKFSQLIIGRSNLPYEKLIEFQSSSRLFRIK